jgi:aspartate-semialdehyde dehydrogenase
MMATPEAYPSMPRSLNVAIVGATGLVGRELLRVMEERSFPVAGLRLLASSRSAGTSIRFRGEEYTVEETTAESFAGADLVFISVSSEISRQLVPIAAKAGAVVIDDSKAWRLEPHVPLVVPEVNGDALAGHRGIIATPNCEVVPLCLCLFPLHRRNPVRRIIVDTYQSVSGTGWAAVEELKEQARAALEGRESAPRVYPHPIAFNVIPQVEPFGEDGYTREEATIVHETRKVMGEPGLAISATCVRVPVMVGHSLAVHVEFERPFDPHEARELLHQAPGVRVLDDPASSVYPTPLQAAGDDHCLVGRIRRDSSCERGLALWISCDNLRKGAALNLVQIAEELLSRNLI